MRDDLHIAEVRRKRSRLYQMLAALHAGPLGYELMPSIRQLAKDVIGLEQFPEVSPAPPADLHRWSYGYCSGQTQLGCPAKSPSDCIPAKFMHLANSARKGATRRRQDEADYIENQLLPCLKHNQFMMDVTAYQDLMRFSQAIVQADAQWLHAQFACGVAMKSENGVVYVEAA